MVLSNTGLIQLAGEIRVPAVLQSNLSCSLNNQTTSPKATLQPGDVMLCHASYTATATDFSMGEIFFNMSARATATNIILDRFLAVPAQQRPYLAIDVRTSDCSRQLSGAGEQGSVSTITLSGFMLHCQRS